MQTRGTKAIKPHKPRANTSWFKHKEFHDLLLCISPGHQERLTVDSPTSLIQEIYHLNKTKQGEFIIGKITRSFVHVFRAR